MASVDPDDDRIRRYVVYRYAYDPARRERRHRVIAAVDNKLEYKRLIDEANAELERRRAAGQNVHRSEHISGMRLEPGHKRRAQNGRLIFRALAHGVWDPRLEELELPPEMSSYQ